MSDPKRAQFVVKRAGGKKQTIDVDFNPASLQLTMETKLAQSKDKKLGKQQVVNESTSKLSMELVFDTTVTGANVCDKTEQVARMLGDTKGSPPPEVLFSWGAFAFTGLVDSYKETIEFFSADGVPLRSTVALGMTSKKDVFNRGPDGLKAGKWAGSSSMEKGATETPRAPGQSTTDAGTEGGDPNAGRAIAEQNSEENMRFPESDTLTVDDAAPLAPPVPFAEGGSGAGFGASAELGFGISAEFGFSAEFGIGVSADFGVSAEFGLGVSADLGISSDFGGGGGSSGIGGSSGGGVSGGLGSSAGGTSRPSGASAGPSRSSGGRTLGAVGAAGPRARLSGGATAGATRGTRSGLPGQTSAAAGGPARGSRASAGVPATQGAFDGIHTPSPGQGAARRPRLDPSRLLPSSEPGTERVDEDAVFEIGGKLVAGAPRLGGAKRRVRFDEE
ncbi:CIS tube protein [Polyangium mundeleinium]|uniref:Contractile injection system tube protein N-terminal domain-containing protein n=1 Tax=Polyangium mundeleinium TaxID=2995306 RepID=A0ABT5F1B2_9BACT|nr:hypothetical protein [Polyangium mundeleinium]MDC0747863.1 hypothetical protein [Polyangium mundeleinium]